MTTRTVLRTLCLSLGPEAGGRTGDALRRELADWTPLLALANSHLLTPALYASLLRAGALSDTPAEARQYLGFLHRENAKRNHAIENQIGRVVQALNGAGIVPVFLKGAATLKRGLHLDPGARMMRDIDVLVERYEADRAVEALSGIGYAIATRYPDGHHAVADLSLDGVPAAVDLHAELVDPRYMFSASELRKRALPCQERGLRFAVPCPDDMVLHNVIHAQIHFLGNYYRGALDLHQVHDFSMMVRRFGAAVDWGALEKRLGEHRVDRALHVFALAATRLFGVPWPLTRPASRAARLTYRIGVAELLMPALGNMLAPMGNFLGAFAWHRMRGLYGDDSPLLVRRLRHAWNFVRKTTPRAAFVRMFRAH
jgi:hypothetical protein